MDANDSSRRFHGYRYFSPALPCCYLRHENSHVPFQFLLLLNLCHPNQKNSSCEIATPSKTSTALKSQPLLAENGKMREFVYKVSSHWGFHREMTDCAAQHNSFWELTPFENFHLHQITKWHFRFFLFWREWRQLRKWRKCALSVNKTVRLIYKGFSFQAERRRVEYHTAIRSMTGITSSSSKTDNKTCQVATIKVVDTIELAWIPQRLPYAAEALWLGGKPLTHC